EGFRAQNAISGIEAAKDRGLEKETAGRGRRLDALAATQQRRAIIERLLHQALVLVQLRERRHRTHLRRGQQRIANADALRALDQSRHELFVDFAVYVSPRPGDAGLSGGSEDSAQNSCLDRTQIRVRKNDLRTLASELQGAACQSATGPFRDGTPSLDAAGEG